MSSREGSMDDGSRVAALWSRIHDCCKLILKQDEQNARLAAHLLESMRSAEGKAAKEGDDPSQEGGSLSESSILIPENQRLKEHRAACAPNNCCTILIFTTLVIMTWLLVAFRGFGFFEKEASLDLIHELEKDLQSSKTEIKSLVSKMDKQSATIKKLQSQLSGDHAKMEELSKASKDLQHAAFRGHLEDAEKAVSLGADLNAGDEWGYTPIMRAAEFGHVAILEMLIAKGAKVNKMSNQGVTALILASENGYWQAIEKLLAAGADKQTKSSCGESAKAVICREKLCTNSTEQKVRELLS